jgi:hypothetical protein
MTIAASCWLREYRANDEISREGVATWGLRPSPTNTGICRCCLMVRAHNSRSHFFVVKFD